MLKSERINFLAKKVAPNPLEATYWIDLTEGPQGTVWKWFDPEDNIWKVLLLGNQEGSPDAYTKAESDRLFATNDSIEQLANELNTKQDTLVSEVNIRTINGISVLGSGDIHIDRGLNQEQVQDMIDESTKDFITVDETHEYVQEEIEKLKLVVLDKDKLSESISNLIFSNIVDFETLKEDLSITENHLLYVDPDNGMYRVSYNPNKDEITYTYTTIDKGELVQVYHTITSTEKSEYTVRRDIVNYTDNVHDGITITNEEQGTTRNITLYTRGTGESYLSDNGQYKVIGSINLYTSMDRLPDCLAVLLDDDQVEVNRFTDAKQYLTDLNEPVYLLLTDIYNESVDQRTIEGNQLYSFYYDSVSDSIYIVGTIEPLHQIYNTVDPQPIVTEVTQITNTAKIVRRRITNGLYTDTQGFDIRIEDDTFDSVDNPTGTTTIRSLSFITEGNGKDVLFNDGKYRNLQDSIDFSNFLGKDNETPYTPTRPYHPATKKYVDDSINALIDSAPSDLNTLRKLANAINNDPNFHVTITNLINTKEDHVNIGEVSQLQTDSKVVVPAINEHEAQINQAQSDIDALEEQDKKHDQQISDINTELDVHQNSITDLYNQVDRIDSNIDDIEKNLSDNVDRIDQNIDAIETNIDNIEVNINNIETNIDAIEGNINKIENNIDSIEQNIDQIEENINSVEENIDQVEQSIVDLTNKHNQDVTKLNQDITNLTNKHNQDVTDINSKIDSNVATINKAISDLEDKHDSDISTVNSTITNVQNTLQNNIDTVKNDLTEDITELTSKHNSDVNAINTNINSINQNINQIEQNVDNIESDISQINTDITNINAKDSQQDQSISDINDQLDILNNTLDFDGDGSKYLADDGTYKVFPTKVSQFQNDSNYQTKTQVDQAIADLVGSAPETLDTLNELADALGNDPNFATTVANQIGLKADKADIGTVTQLTTTAKIVVPAINEHETQINSNTSSINNINTQITDINQQIEDINNSTTGDITQINQDIDNIQQDITNIENDISSINTNITGIEGDITDIQGDITNIEGDITDIRGDITEIINKNNQQDTEIASKFELPTGGTIGQVLKKQADGTMGWANDNDTIVTWNTLSGKPTLATVATSGSYNDLTDKPTIPSQYVLPTASSSTKGGIFIGYAETGQNYPVELDNNSKAYVNVPWVNTTYNNASSNAAGLMSSADKTKLDGIQAGADTVSFTRNLSSGTKIGTININGTSTDIYAPTPEGGGSTVTYTPTVTSGVQLGTIVIDGVSKVIYAPEDAGSDVTWSATQTSGTKIGTLNVDGTDYVLYAPTPTTYSNATTTQSGLMSSTDKSKLDGIRAGADSVEWSGALSTGTNIGTLKINDSSYNLYAPTAGEPVTYNQATSTTLGLVKIGYPESGKNYPVELNSSGQMFVNVPWTDTNTTYENATTTTDGLMSSEDKTKLDSIPSNLPIASATTLGGIKIGDGLEVETDGTVNVTEGGGTATDISVPIYKTFQTLVGKNNSGAGKQFTVPIEGTPKFVTIWVGTNSTVHSSAGPTNGKEVGAGQHCYTWPILSTNQQIGITMKVPYTIMQSNVDLGLNNLTYSVCQNLSLTYTYDSTSITFTQSTTDGYYCTEENDLIFQWVSITCEATETVQAVIESFTENPYTLPAATSNALGGIKVGSGLSISSDGTLSATGSSTAASNMTIVTLNGNKNTSDDDFITNIDVNNSDTYITFNIPELYTSTYQHVVIDKLVLTAYMSIEDTGSIGSSYTGKGRLIDLTPLIVGDETGSIEFSETDIFNSIPIVGGGGTAINYRTISYNLLVDYTTSVTVSEYDRQIHLQVSKTMDDTYNISVGDIVAVKLRLICYN